MRRQLITFTLYLSLLLIGISMVVILYWLYSPPKDAIAVSPHPIPVVNKVVKRDGTCAALGYERCVVLKLTRCKHVTAEGRVVTTLVGETERIPLPVVYDRGDRKCENDVSVPIAIPESALPGKYTFTFIVTFKVNPLTTITQEYTTESFEVQ